MIAACAGHPEPLWDATLEGEEEHERVARHTRALAFCRICPARVPCLELVDITQDDGIWGAVLLPTLHDSDRRATGAHQPGRGGLAQLVGGRETLRCSRGTSDYATVA